jgi:hypothetical protein
MTNRAPPIETVRAGLTLYHQRTTQFGNEGSKPYHPIFNYFCKHPYYGTNNPDMNTYKYELTHDVPNMIRLSEDFDWEDLQASVNAQTRHEYKLVALAMTQWGCNGIFFDFPGDPSRGISASNEYIFSPDIVQTHLKFISKVIRNPEIAESETSGFYCGEL